MLHALSGHGGFERSTDSALLLGSGPTVDGSDVIPGDLQTTNCKYLVQIVQ